MSGLSLRAYNARFVRKPKAKADNDLIGPFTIRHIQRQQRLQIFLQPIGRYTQVMPRASYRRGLPSDAKAWMGGVLETAMHMIWGCDPMQPEFEANGVRWRIAKVQPVEARDVA